MDWRVFVDDALSQAVSIVAEKDSGAFRQHVFADLAIRRRLIRVARKTHQLLGRGWLSTWFVCLYGIRAYLGVASPASGGRMVAACAYRNERRQIEALQKWVPEHPIQSVRMSKGYLLHPLSWFRLLWACCQWRKLRISLRLIHEYNQRGDFLVACRVASTVGFYWRFKRMLSSNTSRAVVVSSDSNPYAMALVFAARTHGMKTMYITHGHLPEGPPVLDFDLSILDGPALLDVYRAVGPVEGNVVFKGSEGSFRPMDCSGLRREKPVIGLFTSLVMDWKRFKTIVQQVRDVLRPDTIVVRFHPNQLVREDAAIRWANAQPDVEVSLGERVLLDDAARCDAVLVGNSSCHLTVLRYGVPSFYVGGLDKVPHDFYRFLALGIVPAYDQVSEGMLQDVSRFYEDPAWVQRFAHFDHGYPGTDQGPAVRTAVEELLNA